MADECVCKLEALALLAAHGILEHSSWRQQAAENVHSPQSLCFHSGLMRALLVDAGA